MFFTQRKLEGRIRELGEYRYRDVRNFESFLAKEDKSGLVNPDVPTDFTGWDRICTGSDWKGRDLYLWLHGEMKVPADRYWGAQTQRRCRQNGKESAR